MTDFNNISGSGNNPGQFYTPNFDERIFAILSHLLTIFFGIFAPLVIWLIKKNESKYVSEHAIESLNFQITLLLAYIVSGVLICLAVGFLMIIVVYVMSVIFAIIATIQASDNKIYKYPFCWRLIK